MSNKLFTGIWGSLLALLMVGIITLNVVLLKYSSLITRSLGHQTVATVNLDTSGDSDYFKSAFATEADLLAHETEISRQIEAEGIVLVKTTRMHCRCKRERKSASLVRHQRSSAMAAAVPAPLTRQTCRA